jgi:hypothetical protein
MTMASTMAMRGGATQEELTAAAGRGRTSRYCRHVMYHVYFCGGGEEKETTCHDSTSTKSSRA